MCFFNSQNKRALAIAKRYGRQSDIVEIAKEILEEQRQAEEIEETGTHFVQKAFLHPDCYVVTHDEQLQTAKWGLIPFWVREVEKAESIRKMTANAKAETAASLPSFREAIKRRRCLIPSTGFYEYHHEGKEAIPYRISLRDTDIFSLAGVYDEWRHPATKELIRTFAVLTVPANELCGFIHNGGRNPRRMPGILTAADEMTWLRPDLTDDDIRGLLRPYDSVSMDAVVLEKDFLRRA